MTEKDIAKIFSDNFKRLRKSKKLLQKDVAKKLGVSSSIVSDWEKGVKMPRGAAIQKIADFFGIPQSQLFIENGTQYSTLGEMVMLPIVGQISCGNGNIAYEDIEGYEPTPKEWVTSGEFFYLRAKGDSMIGARIADGDLLLIRKQETIENGEIAAVLLDNEAVLKRVYKHDGMLVLQSENPAYAPIICKPEDKNIRIIGKLKKIIINV